MVSVPSSPPSRWFPGQSTNCGLDDETERVRDALQRCERLIPQSEKLSNKSRHRRRRGAVSKCYVECPNIQRCYINVAYVLCFHIQAAICLPSERRLSKRSRKISEIILPKPSSSAVMHPNTDTVTSVTVTPVTMTIAYSDSF